MSWYWREVDTKDSAKDATKPAVGVSYFIAAVTGLVAFLSILSHHPIIGLNGWSLVDAALFCVIGWRISRLSRAWAVVGLCGYALEVADSIGRRGIGFSVLSVIFILAYINAVRGAFAYQQFLKLERAELSLPAPSDVNSAQTSS